MMLQFVRFPFSLRRREPAPASPRPLRRATRLLCCFAILSAFGLVYTFSHAKPAYATTNPACSLTVSSATTVVSAATENSIGLGSWPDTKLGVVKNGSNYEFIGAIGSGVVAGASGTLDNPVAGGVITNASIQHLQHTYNYAGGGKIYNDTAHNTLIMLYHAETWPNGDSSKFYVHFGLAKSTDNGITWTDLGEILAPHVPYTTTNPQTEDMGDGTFAVVNSGGTNYLFVYHAEPGEANLAVARAPLTDVLNAAEQTPGTVVPFYKYYQGAWNEPGEGGNSSEIDSTSSSGGMGYSDISYNSDIGRYIMIGFANWPATELDMIESSDGVTWGNRQVVFTQAGDLDVYMAIVGQGADPNTSSGSFYLYYTDRVNGWPIERRTLSCNGPASQSDAGTYDAKNGFSSTQGVNRWRYQSTTNDTDNTSYTDMSWNSSNNWWVGSEQYEIVAGSWQEPGNNSDSALTWVAPQDGPVTITANGSLSDESGGNGVNVRVIQNTTQIWPASGWQSIAAGGSVSFPATTVTVHVGDQLHFIVNSNGNNAYDVTNWDPVVTYATYQASQQASLGFSSTQGTNQWSYEQSTDGEQSFQTMSWDSGNNRWQGSESYCLIGSGWQHPGNNTCDSVRVWTATTAGSVTLSANGSLSVTSSCGGNTSGVNIRILKNGSQIWPSSGWQNIPNGSSYNFPAGVSTSVAAGDQLQFVISHAGSVNYCDATSWDQIVS